jgi:xylulokinase
MDIMRSMGMEIRLVRAGKANMFLSPVFREAFVNSTSVRLELINTDGSQGAARGAGIGAGIYRNPGIAFSGLKVIERVVPERKKTDQYSKAYDNWVLQLNKHLT